MARKTVRVDVPTSNPDKLIQLGKDILTQNAKAPASNQLDAAKMGKLKTAIGIADGNNVQAKQLDGQSQLLRQQRDTALGTATGQTAMTPDTALNLINYSRDLLLTNNAGNEELLSQYGFNVVIGQAKSPTKPQPAAK